MLSCIQSESVVVGKSTRGQAFWPIAVPQLAPALVWITRRCSVANQCTQWLRCTSMCFTILFSRVSARWAKQTIVTCHLLLVLVVVLDPVSVSCSPLLRGRRLLEKHTSGECWACFRLVTCPQQQQQQYCHSITHAAAQEHLLQSSTASC